MDQEDDPSSDLHGSDNEGYKLEDSSYVPEIHHQAQECLVRFFKGKKFWAGGPVNLAHILNDRVVRVVMETSIIDGVDVAYRSLSSSTPDNCDIRQEFWEVKLVKGVLDDCGTLGIPKCFAAGLMLVFLEQCHGVETLRRLEKYNYYRKQLAKGIKQKEQGLELQTAVVG